MTYKNAKTLLSKDIDIMALEQVQKHKVRLLDAWRHSKAQYGFEEAVKNGFYKVVASESASGYTPTDMWLTYQLEYVLDKAEERERQLLCMG